MNRIVRFVGLLAGAAAAGWLMKDRLLPSPETQGDAPPSFRVGPGATAAPPPDLVAPAPGDTEVEAEDLTLIKGIGPVYSQRLARAGVISFDQLAAADAAALAQTLDLPETTILEWIEQARDLSD
jgi:predicted flap endonuclease-1-like 5' DNA nuclease